MGRFNTEFLATDENLTALAGLEFGPQLLYNIKLEYRHEFTLQSKCQIKFETENRLAGNSKGFNLTLSLSSHRGDRDLQPAFRNQHALA